MTENGDLEKILIGLGANLPGSAGAPRQTLLAAIARLRQNGLKIGEISSFWKTRPVPVSDQPWFVNAVLSLREAPPPEELLARLHAIEQEFGRIRGVVNQARTLDLDLLAYGRTILSGPGLILPHPRLEQRAFVLIPLQEIAPAWRHPVSQEGVEALIARLPPEQEIVRDA
ncbi:MAG: 2-amino-4-hydroxy-6-hydroxymethyldihydropteridine diphosphokinase [Rhodospirillaceae bacterium]|nr:2-amino-4-hydroxy-6-hydroxymethyldihydropteridine diphosphokinase [Rhodospirillaceae bacterium]